VLTGGSSSAQRLTIEAALNDAQVQRFLHTMPQLQVFQSIGSFFLKHLFKTDISMKKDRVGQK
jgi:hypothetical protein